MFDAKKLHLIKSNSKSPGTCEIQPHILERLKKKKLINLKLSDFPTTDTMFRTVSLNIFAEKCINKVVRPTSPYVEIPEKNESKRVIVKKIRSVGCL